MMRRTASVSISLVVGTLILGTALFAYELGLDPNASWGGGRIATLVFGLLIAAIPWLVKGRSAVPNKTTGNDLFAFPVLLVVIGVYLWFTGNSHENASAYYALQAASFRQGELSLPLKPDPALLALPDPYEPIARQGVKAPVDLSLYNGKFYLYWGPAPSLILAMIAPIFPGKIDDGYLLFIFTSGTFLVQFLLIMMVWERFFPNLPKWIVLVSILGAGLMGTSTWLLTTPKIYETAIAGGQFFLMGGFFVALSALGETPSSSWKLPVAGLFLGLAVATRMVLAAPVIFLTAAVAYRLYKMNQALLTTVVQLILLGFPLFLAAAGIGWYNWARFGSISESGLFYQLAGPHLQKHYADLFSPVYFLQNARNYLLNPFVVEPQFPYFHSIRGVSREVFSFYVLPELYSAQAVTGLFQLAPFTLFAIMPTVVTLAGIFKKKPAQNLEEDDGKSLQSWIIISLGGSFLLTFILLQMFFWTAMRYMEDFMPSLVLVGMIGFWQGYRYLSAKRTARRLYVFLGCMVMGYSIVTGVLLSLSKLAEQSQLVVPAFWEQFQNLFQR